MRTVFLGTPRAAVPSLSALAASAHAPAAVVCRPDRPSGRGLRSAAPPVKEAALELGLPVLQPESVAASAFRRALAAHEPEVLVVVAFGRILGPKLRSVAPRGALNVHFSLLPRWRGAAPVQRAMLAGDEATGVSLMQLVDELDAGPVYRQESLGIGPEERAPELEARLADLGSRLLVEVLDALAAGAIEAREQDPRLVTLAPPLRREEGALDLRRPAAELERRVRALDPWPGSRFELAGRGVQVLRARSREAAAGGSEPGRVLGAEGEGLLLACGEGTALLLELVKPEGRQAMSGRSLLNGRLVAVGDLVSIPEGA